MISYVWKFPLPLSDGPHTVAMPAAAEILYVAAQGQSVCLWAQVTAEAARSEYRTERRFIIVGTGHPFDPEGHTHVGSCLMMGGQFVWHVYEQTA
jgi:hypothetical protein